MTRVSYINNLGLTTSHQLDSREEASLWLLNEARGADVRPRLGRPMMAMIFDTTTQQTTPIIVTCDEHNKAKLVEFGPELLNNVTRVLGDIDVFYQTGGGMLSEGAMIHDDDSTVRESVHDVMKRLR